MKNREQKLVLLLAFLVTPGLGWPNSNEKGRKSYPYPEDILLTYNWITGPDSSQIREMQAEFTVNASLDKIISHFTVAESYAQWAAGIKECNVFQAGDSVWYTYALMNYPWPFRRKDLVTKHQLFSSDSAIIIQVNAESGFMPEKDGVDRLKSYRGRWILSAGMDGTTIVRYSVVSYEKPLFPRFIQDPVIQGIVIGSLRNLKKIAER